MAIDLIRAGTRPGASHHTRNALGTDNGHRARAIDPAADGARAGVIALADASVGADRGTHGSGVDVWFRISRVQLQGVIGGVGVSVSNSVNIARCVAVVGPGLGRAPVLFRSKQHVGKGARSRGQRGRSCDGDRDEESFLHITRLNSSLAKKRDAVRELLRPKAEQFKCVWPLLRDWLLLCHAFVSSTAFTVTPWVPLVDAVTNVEQRRVSDTICTAASYIGTVSPSSAGD